MPRWIIHAFCWWCQHDIRLEKRFGWGPKMGYEFACIVTRLLPIIMQFWDKCADLAVYLTLLRWLEIDLKMGFGCSPKLTYIGRYTMTWLMLMVVQFMWQMCWFGDTFNPAELTEKLIKTGVLDVAPHWHELWVLPWHDWCQFYHDMADANVR